MNRDLAHQTTITLLCETCGKEGTLHVTTKRVPVSIRDFKLSKDEFGKPVKEPFKRRRLSQNKHLSFIRLLSYLHGGEDQLLDQIVNERPMLMTNSISSVNSDPSSDSEIAKIHNETIELFVDIMLDLMASVVAVRNILLLLVETKTYPGPLAYVMMINLREGEKLEHELWKSVEDDRMQRSLVEWFLIARKAEKSSASAASRKYFAYSSDGKRLHLNTRHIEEKKLIVSEFWDRFSNTYDKYLRAKDTIMEIICEDQDMDLYSEYQKSRERIKNQIKEPWKQKNKGETAQEKSTIRYKTYHYFNIRHPIDAQLYAIQKEKYMLDPEANPKPTGIVEHKLHNSKVPRSVVEDLEKGDRS